MKTMSEVCHLSGVSRKTLRGYDQMGLVKPAQKTEQGYWLYDDQAIDLIMLIQVFFEAGYDRKMILNMLNDPDLDLHKEYDKAIEMLMEKQKKIRGMIAAIRQNQMLLDLPKPFRNIICNMDPEQLLKKKNAKEAWMDMVQSYADGEATVDGDEQDAIKALWYLGTIGSLDQKGQEKERQEIIQALIRLIDPEAVVESQEEVTEMLEEIRTIFVPVIQQKEVREYMEALFGPGIVEKISQGLWPDYFSQQND